MGAIHRRARHVLQRVGLVPARPPGDDAPRHRPGAIRPEPPGVRRDEDDVRVEPVRPHPRHVRRRPVAFESRRGVPRGKQPRARAIPLPRLRLRELPGTPLERVRGVREGGEENPALRGTAHALGGCNHNHDWSATEKTPPKSTKQREVCTPGTGGSWRSKTPSPGTSRRSSRRRSRRARCRSTTETPGRRGRCSGGRPTWTCSRRGGSWGSSPRSAEPRGLGRHREARGGHRSRPGEVRGVRGRRGRAEQTPELETYGEGPDAFEKGTHYPNEPFPLPGGRSRIRRTNARARRARRWRNSKRSSSQRCGRRRDERRGRERRTRTEASSLGSTPAEGFLPNATRLARRRNSFYDAAPRAGLVSCAQSASHPSRRRRTGACARPSVRCTPPRTSSPTRARGSEPAEASDAAGEPKPWESSRATAFSSAAGAPFASFASIASFTSSASIGCTIRDDPSSFSFAAAAATPSPAAA